MHGIDQLENVVVGIEFAQLAADVHFNFKQLMLCFGHQVGDCAALLLACTEQALKVRNVCSGRRGLDGFKLLDPELGHFDCIERGRQLSPPQELAHWLSTA